MHYFDKMKSFFINTPHEALRHLQSAAVDSVSKDIESYMFINQLVGDKEATRSEIVQQSLANLIEIMEEKNRELEEIA